MHTDKNILDVTLLQPQLKHPTIFNRFDELNIGESLIIQNDHDPKPLYYQLLSLKGNSFTWDYMEKGPEWWKINISKKDAASQNETIGEMVAKDFNKAAIFKKYGLDFCCGGKKTLKEACEKKGIDTSTVAQELMQNQSQTFTRPLQYNEWGAGFLADYIVNTHHRYVTTVLPDITAYALKVAKVHGEHQPELLAINDLVQQINAEMTAHMIKEENILFPYIKKLASSNGETVDEEAYFGTIKNPINMMEAEHEQVGENLEAIRKLSNNYSLPADACATYTVLYQLLNDFENDLHIHVHLENNILFPKAIALEQRQQINL